MPYKVTEDLYSTTDPTAPKFDGTVGESGNYQVASAGGLLSDEDAERLGLTGQLEHVTLEQVAAEQDAANRATYTQNAGSSPAHKGYPAAPAAAPSSAPSAATAQPAPAAPEAAPSKPAKK